MVDERSQTVDTKLSPVVARLLPDEASLSWDALECERHQSKDAEEVTAFNKDLMEKDVIEPSRTNLEIGTCRLVPTRYGVFDLKAKGDDPEKWMTKPSIAWTCAPYECSISADVPVPQRRKEEFKKEFQFFDPKCGLGIIHFHDDAIAPEAHMHIVCSGVAPHALSSLVTRLARKALKYRGVNIEE